MAEIYLMMKIQDRVRANRGAKGKAPANWFRDPQREAPYRYWDGEAWTDETADSLP